MLNLLKRMRPILQADKVLQQFLTEFQRVFDTWQPNEAIFTGARSSQSAPPPPPPPHSYGRARKTLWRHVGSCQTQPLIQQCLADPGACFRGPASLPGGPATQGGLLVRGCRGGHPMDVLAALAGGAAQLSQNLGQGITFRDII